jgi:hypothetical protein
MTLSLYLSWVKNHSGEHKKTKTLYIVFILINKYSISLIITAAILFTLATQLGGWLIISWSDEGGTVLKYKTIVEEPCTKI